MLGLWLVASLSGCTGGDLTEERFIETYAKEACKAMMECDRGYLLDEFGDLDECREEYEDLLEDVFEDDTDVHMVMELCEGASLTDAVAAGRLQSEQDIAIVMSSILRFIAQCHGKGLVYRDVKPDNFIFVRDELHTPLKATDFGLSIKHRIGESPLTSRSGTPAYMAPEVRAASS